MKPQDKTIQLTENTTLAEFLDIILGKLIAARHAAHIAAIRHH